MLHKLLASQSAAAGGVDSTFAAALKHRGVEATAAEYCDRVNEGGKLAMTTDSEGGMTSRAPASGLPVPHILVLTLDRSALSDSEGLVASDTPVTLPVRRTTGRTLQEQAQDAVTCCTPPNSEEETDAWENYKNITVSHFNVGLHEDVCCSHACTHYHAFALHAHSLLYDCVYECMYVRA
jgi:hypothetical protein